MNYEEAVSYINELQMFARKHTLDHTRAFLSYLGTPQEKKKMIHGKISLQRKKCIMKFESLGNKKESMSLKNLQ